MFSQAVYPVHKGGESGVFRLQRRYSFPRQQWDKILETEVNFCGIRISLLNHCVGWGILLRFKARWV